MKTYEIYLHGKQGDDFAAHIEKSKNVWAALAVWTEDFRKRADICDRIARAIYQKNVQVEADTHMILFIPQDTTAEKAFDELLAAGLVHRSSMDEADGDDDDLDE